MKPTHIVINDLNKARRIFNIAFVGNVLPYTDQNAQALDDAEISWDATIRVRRHNMGPNLLHQSVFKPKR